MSYPWMLIYVLVALWLIWWVLREARKLDVGHGDHVHDGDPPEQETNVPLRVDDLTQIKGVGAVIAAKLRTLNITTYQQIADLNSTGIEKINAELNFKGRIEREQWVQQAQEILNRDGE